MCGNQAHTGGFNRAAVCVVYRCSQREIRGVDSVAMPSVSPWSESPGTEWRVTPCRTGLEIGLAADLKRVLNWWDSLAIAVSIVIGVGIFRVPAEVAQNLQSAGLIIVAWVVAGVFCFLGALCYSELSSTFPESGGNYVYLRESFGRGIGFLFGWTELVVIRTGSIAAVAYVFAEHLHSFLPENFLPVKVLALAVVVSLAIVNIFGLHPSKIFQDTVTVLTLTSIAVIVVIGVFSGAGDVSNFKTEGASQEPPLVAAMGLSLIAILWTYGGWHESSFVSEETKNPEKALPLILISSVFLITFIYLALNLVYIYIIPVDVIAETPLIGVSVMNVLFGSLGENFFALLIVVSSLGAINAMIITGSRITYAMAKDHRIFGYLSAVDGRRGTPIRSIVLNAAWSSGLILWGSFHKLLYFTGIVFWLFFALVVCGLVVLRRKHPEIERPFRTPGYPVVPAVFVIACLVLMVNTLVFSPRESVFGLSLMLSGVPLFFLSKWRERRRITGL